jgi:hypothetical protein
MPLRRSGRRPRPARNSQPDPLRHLRGARASLGHLGESNRDPHGIRGGRPRAGQIARAGALALHGHRRGTFRVGAVLLSPFIKQGTLSTTDYNHYSSLATWQSLLALPRLAFSAPVPTTFGSDVFTAAP